MEKSLRNPSLKTLYSVLKNFREEYTDFEALASYYEDHYQDQNSKNLNLKHFLLTCVEDPRMRAKENIAQYILMLDSLEVLKRERAALKNAKLPPGHPTRLQNRRQNYEYLRLQSTIKHHFRHFHIELLREEKLREAAGKKQTEKQKPATKEKEDGATAAAEEEALASQGKEEGAKEKEEEEEAAPGEEQQALEENEKEGAEEGGPPEDQAPAVEEKMEEQSPAVQEQVGRKRKRNEEQAPAAENKEEGSDGEEEAPPEEERLTLRKRPRKDYRGFSFPPEDSSDCSAATDPTLLLACLLWLFVHICVFVCVYVFL
ncbi:myb-like protein X [Xenopus laevis]|uniref:Myb-like protein X n=1 Tax=Xenopus laevis TaxID=8355 RepID=A0A8J1LJY6_XENLA|nr:myb-like protein X [Xenopus laevis]